MDFRMRLALVCLTAIMFVSVAGFAQVANNQVAANNLVNVNLSDIKLDVAKNINVDVSQVPVTVQAPIDVAAAVCGVSVDALTSQVQQGNNTCKATTDNAAINTIVQDQLKNQSNK